MIKYIICLFIMILISSCSGNDTDLTNPITGKKNNPGIFSKDVEKGISLSDVLNPNDTDSSNLSINGFLWRASLNVLSIAPLISTDALGGTIITDWYVNKNVKDKRIKITTFITY